MGGGSRIYVPGGASLFLRACVCGFLSFVIIFSPATLVSARGVDLGPLYELYEIDQTPLHHVLLVDVSGSMKGIFPSVIAAVGDYLGQIRDTDTVSIVVFSDDVEVLNSAAPAADATRLTALLPDSPTGTATDIAAGLDAAVGEIARHDGEAHVLIMLTDDADEPPQDSPLAQYGAQKWDVVRDRADAAAEGKTVYGVGIGLGADGAGAPLITRVIRDSESFLISVGALGGHLTDVRERVRREQLKSAVEEDLAAGSVSVSLVVDDLRLSDGENRLGKLTAISMYGRLPVSLDLGVDVAPGQWSDFAPVDPARVAAASTTFAWELTPGQTEERALAFESD